MFRTRATNSTSAWRPYRHLKLYKRLILEYYLKLDRLAVTCEVRVSAAEDSPRSNEGACQEEPRFKTVISGGSRKGRRLSQKIGTLDLDERVWHKASRSSGCQDSVPRPDGFWSDRETASPFEPDREPPERQVGCCVALQHTPSMPFVKGETYDPSTFRSQ